MTDLLAAMRRLLAAKRATANLPPAGGFAVTVGRLAALAEVPPPVLVWTLDGVRK